MIKLFRTAALLLTCCSVSYTTMAWGVQGHRVVGEVANRYISKKTGRAFAAILGHESIAMTSNWADFIKSDPSYNYLSNWHYINLPAGLTRDAVFNFLATDTATDVYTKINWLVQELKNKNLEAEKKKLYLRLLIHFVGDVHQPMHVGRPEDLGGNRITVNWFSDASNLHQVWDSRIIDFQHLSYTEHAAAVDYSNKSLRKQWQTQPVQEWIWESYQLAETIYAGVKTGDRLSYDYNFKHIATVNDQLLKAGIRLAGLLNDIFG